MKSRTWICSCGIANWHEDYECAQCGLSKEEGWDEVDRERHSVMVLDSTGQIIDEMCSVKLMP
jgi:hypothetical protein